MKSELKKTLQIIACGIFVSVGVTSTRACIDGRSYLELGDKAYENKNKEEALHYWRRAARWYLPLASHDDEAYLRMEQLAQDAFMAKDIEGELAALRGIRSSVWAVRSVIRPHQEKLPSVCRRIAEIMAGVEDPQLTPNATFEERVSWHEQALLKDDAPHRGWTLVAALGFLAWLLSLIGFAKRGFTADGVLIKRVAIYSGFFFCAGFLLWLYGLWMA